MMQDAGNPSISSNQKEITSMLIGIPGPVVGDRLIASRYGNDDTLETDDEYYYFTHDTGGDLCAWKFKRPPRVTEQQIVDAFKTQSAFLRWMSEKGSRIEVTPWW